MLFNSLAFLAFLPITLVLYRSLPKAASKYVILAASYVFYAFWDWRFLSLIVASTLVDFLSGIAIENSEHPARRRRFLLLSICFNLGILGFFKYFNFFLTSLESLLSSVGLENPSTTLHIVLPVGISFYTFQTMSYTIDVWQKTVKAERDLITFASFVAFFPQLVAGPIERAADLLPQLRTRTSTQLNDIKRAAWWILWGFFLKVFMADNLAQIVDSIYENLEIRTGTELLIAHYAFAFQIFGDFAGYSSIAIGVAQLFGVRLNQNFGFPYFVTSPSQFWRHWHISLSNWLRDYLYIPLGGNRGTTFQVSRNLLVTMLLGGLWHGAAWNFIAWGLFHGGILVGFRNMGSSNIARTVQKLPWLLKVGGMFHLTCLGWMLFRVPNLSSIGVIFSRALNHPFASDWQTLHWLLLSAFHIVPTLVILTRQYQAKEPQSNPFPDSPFMIFSVFMIVVLFGEWGTKSFIYFQF